MRIKFMLTLLLIILLLGSFKQNKELLVDIYTRSQAEAQKNNFKEALNIIETEIKSSQRDHAYYRFHGIYTLYQNPRKYASLALEDFKKSYQTNKNSFLNNQLVGKCYLIMGNYHEAIIYFEKANNLYKDGQSGPPVYYDLAEAYLLGGNINKALEISNIAMEKDPDYSWNYIQRGVILSQSGNKELLYEYYEKAVELDPNDYEIHREYIKRLIEMQYYNDAYDLCVALVNNNAPVKWEYAYMGFIKIIEGDFDKGKVFLDEAYSLDNTDPYTLKILSFYFYFKRNLDKAWEYDVLASINGGVPVHIFETENEYILRNEKDRDFKILYEINRPAGERDGTDY